MMAGIIHGYAHPPMAGTTSFVYDMYRLTENISGLSTAEVKHCYVDELIAV